jgi:hypothetical protein
MLGSTTFTVSGNTCCLINYTPIGQPQSGLQYMAGFESDEWPVDPVVVISGNQGTVPEGYTPTSKQTILLGLNGSDLSHTFSLLANGHMGVGLDNTWTGSYGDGVISTERLTEQITIPNGAFLAGRNAADTSTDQLIGYNDGNQVSIAPAGQQTVIGGGLSVNGPLVVNGTDYAALIQMLVTELHKQQHEIAKLRAEIHAAQRPTTDRR